MILPRSKKASETLISELRKSPESVSDTTVKSEFDLMFAPEDAGECLIKTSLTKPVLKSKVSEELSVLMEILFGT